MTREFVAAMMRHASAADEDIVRAAVDAKVEALRADDEKRMQREIEARTSELRALREQLADIERISGVEIARWSDSEEIGQAGKAVLASDVMDSFGRLTSLRKKIASILEQCDEALAILPTNDPRSDDEAADIGGAT
ncbi:hypothetical protein [Burkholderia sp. 567]|uniref:hypothetical protein n=1 Tax=Burkholderia sp. 567 TaxID=3156413 RepID=UPI0033991833